MKKTLFIALFLIAGITASFANSSLFLDDARAISFNQLPAKAQTFLKANFANKTPLNIFVDDDDYEIIYQSGEKVEFDLKGNWKDVDCNKSAVPAGVIPAKIASYVKANYPKSSITDIEKDRGGYDIELTNGLEIKFNKNFKVVHIER